MKTRDAIIATLLVVLIIPLPVSADGDKAITVGYGGLSYDMQGVGSSNYFELGLSKRMSMNYSVGINFNYFSTPLQEYYPVRDFLTTELLLTRTLGVFGLDGYSSIGLGQTRDLKQQTDYTIALSSGGTMAGKLIPNLFQGSIATGLVVPVTQDSQILLEVNLRSYDIGQVSTGVAVKAQIHFE